MSRRYNNGFIVKNEHPFARFSQTLFQHHIHFPVKHKNRNGIKIVVKILRTFHSSSYNVIYNHLYLIWWMTIESTATTLLAPISFKQIQNIHNVSLFSWLHTSGGNFLASWEHLKSISAKQTNHPHLYIVYRERTTDIRTYTCIHVCLYEFCISVLHVGK